MKVVLLKGIMLILLVVQLNKITAQTKFQFAKSLVCKGYNMIYNAKQQGKFIYINGYFDDSIDFDPSSAKKAFYTPQYQYASYVCKYDTNFNLIWVKILKTSGAQVLLNNIDLQGNKIYGVGTWTGTMDVDPGSGVNNISASSISTFIFCWDTAGNFVWANKNNAITGFIGGNSIAAAQGDLLYITGVFQNKVDFSPGLNTDTTTAKIGATDGYVSVYKKSIGSFIGSTKFKGFGRKDFFQVQVDAQDNILVAGLVRDSFDIDPSNNSQFISGNGADHAFIIKYSNAGALMNWFLYKKDNTNFREILQNGNTIYSYSGYNLVKLNTNLQVQMDKSIGIFIGDIAICENGDLFISGTAANENDLDPDPNNYFIANNTGASFGRYTDTGKFIYAKTIKGGTATNTFYLSKNSFICLGYFQSAANDFDASKNTYTLPYPGRVANVFCFKYNGDKFKTTNLPSTKLCANDTINVGGIKFKGWYNQILSTNITYPPKLNLTIKTIASNNVDSLVSIELNNIYINTYCTIKLDTITNLELNGNSYSWYNCTTKKLVAGKTNRIFVADTNGMFRGKISKDGCVDSSTCYTVTKKVNKTKTINFNTLVFPNPAGKFIVVSSGIVEKITLKIYTTDGKKVHEQIAFTNEKINLPNLLNGRYICNIDSHNTKSRYLLQIEN